MVKSTEIHAIKVKTSQLSLAVELLSKVALPFQKSERQKFLDSAGTRSNCLGEGWQGTKFLGMDCFGVTGLWEFKGGPGITKRIIDKVVVKMTQQFPGTMAPGRSVSEEGEIGRVVANYGSKHLIRQFGGNRVGDTFSKMGYIIRTFLGYCPGGTLQEFLPSEKDLKPKRIYEMDLWQIFLCLAEGVFAMDRGTADLTAPHKIARNQDLMHCDINADNIFFGSRDIQYPRLPICKLADFGEAVFVDSRELQDNDYGAKFLDRGAPTYKPPEEALNQPYCTWQEKDSKIPFKTPRKSTCSSIWKIGALMNALIIRSNINLNPEDVAGTKPPLANNKLFKRDLNHSQGLEENLIRALYSESLLTLVQECLFREPEHRPDCLDLVKRTTAGLIEIKDQYKGRNRMVPPPVPEPWKSMPVGSGGNSSEPPTLWIVAHVKTINGTIIDALALPKPSMFDDAIDAIPIPGFIGRRLKRRFTPTSPSGSETPSMTPSPLSGSGPMADALGLGIGLDAAGATMALSGLSKAQKRAKRRRKRESSTETGEKGKGKRVKMKEPVNCDEEFVELEAGDEEFSDGDSDDDSDGEYVEVDSGQGFFDAEP